MFNRQRAKAALRGSKGGTHKELGPMGESGLFFQAYKRKNAFASREARVGFTAGQLGRDPRLAVSYAIRRALRPYRAISAAIIYDGSGRAIATMDPMTRKRSPLSSGPHGGES